MVLQLLKTIWHVVFPAEIGKPCSRTDLDLEMEALLNVIVDGGPVDFLVSALESTLRQLFNRADSE